MNGNYAAIKGKLYLNSLFVDSFKDDLWLMYENIDIRREGASLLFSPTRPIPTRHYQCDVT